MDPHIDKVNKQLKHAEEDLECLMNSLLSHEKPLTPPQKKQSLSLPLISKEKRRNPESPEERKKKVDWDERNNQILSTREKTKNKFYSSNKQKSSQKKISKEAHFHSNLEMIGRQGRRRKRIEDLDPEQVMEYVKNSQRLTKSTLPEFIFDYFSNLAQLKRPLIKKFKNCLFFGENSDKPTYQGFLYFYDEKLYYGNLMDQQKHGKGVQVNLSSNTIFIGTFNRGKKQGIFQVRKQDEIYHGYLQKNKYSGTGTLKTPYTMYRGEFKEGYRHGRGEQLILKSGLRLCGIFKMNKFYNKGDNIDKKVEKKQRKKEVLNYSKVYDYVFDESETENEKGKEMIRRIMKREVQIEKVVDEEDENLPSPFQKYRKYQK